MKENQKILTAILVISALTITAWQFEIGRLILYPFTVLGTWFHEMGHGLMSVILGGRFESLRIESNGSGLALTAGPYLVGDSLGKALVAMAGPIGPTIFGSIFIITSKTEKYAKWTLGALTLLLLISGVYWVRSWFGIPVVLFFGLLTGFIAYKGSSNLIKYYLIFLGVQACLSVYLSIDYLLTPLVKTASGDQLSDTNAISTYLFMPYWFWGGFIVFLSVVAFWKSLKFALK